MSSSVSNSSSSGITPESEESSSLSTTTHVSQTQLGPQHQDDDDEREEEQDGDSSVVGMMDPFILDPTPTQNGYLSEESADIEFQKGESSPLPAVNTNTLSELAGQLNAFLLQYRIWSTTRPEAEIQLRVDALNTKYNEIMVREQEQEKTRQNYADLLQKVRLLLHTMAGTL